MCLLLKEPTLFVKIASYTQYDELLTMLHLCSSVRRSVLSNMVTIVNQVSRTLTGHHPRNVPKWMALSFPLAEMGFVFKSMCEHVKAMTKQSYTFLFNGEMDQWLGIPEECRTHGFLAGGSLCQVAFGREWKTDLDIFYPLNEFSKIDDKATETGNGSVRTQMTLRQYPNVKLDLVGKTFSHDSDNASQVLTIFDSSVCQIGMTIGPNPVVYATPLFVYSYTKSVVLCRVAALSACYVERVVNGRATDLLKLFRKHRNYLGPEDTMSAHAHPFYSCTHCCWSKDRLKDDAEGLTIRRWFERMKKYAQRFEGWPMQFTD